MTTEDQQALDMVIMDMLMEFKMGGVKLPDALKEINQAMEYYSKPESERD
jgi:hypothetical protein